MISCSVMLFPLGLIFSLFPDFFRVWLPLFQSVTFDSDDMIDLVVVFVHLQKLSAPVTILLNVVESKVSPMEVREVCGL